MSDLLRELDDSSDDTAVVETMISVSDAVIATGAALEAFAHVEEPDASALEDAELALEEDDGATAIEFDNVNFDVGDVNLTTQSACICGRSDRSNSWTDRERLSWRRRWNAGPIWRDAWPSLPMTSATTGARRRARAIYHAFKQGWAHPLAMHRALNGDAPVPARDELLGQMLPGESAREEAAIQQVCAASELAE
ncbi:MAG: hypothetical protein R2839_02310 [Thermomicrobiales bacterium]